ncbi:ornithine cyclodeaminase family protein [Nocardioides kongjuensis]|uniref:Ornithine cyclodeaminase n=1 Tax=Nocardioides kongjuensis TaxID=349522 RepID=A0A852RXE5_9ACTN|nr:ornithine cyclodeaminase family protein [Nocardioides kongjuensis]NYD31202.1 ornithine cyclodeaminase [Nocardioides kongjuensis]
MDEPTLVLSRGDVAALFDADTAYDSQVRAFTAIGQGAARPSAKIMLEHPGLDDLCFTYASRLLPFGAVCKFGSVNPGNAERGIPTISATVLALDAGTGRLAAIIEGTEITTRRTAAATMVAVEALAVPGPLEVAIVGTGVQAAAHVRALAARGRTVEVRIAGRSAQRAASLANELAADTGLTVRGAADVRSAVAGADVVVLGTTSHTPVLDAGWVAGGTLVVSLGSISPTRCEVGQDLLARAARVVVDDRHSAQVQAGPVVAGLASGRLAAADLTGLGEVLVGLAAGRGGDDEIVFYNSTGIGLQDAAAAAAVIATARDRGAGQHLDLSQ